MMKFSGDFDYFGLISHIGTKEVGGEASLEGGVSKSNDKKDGKETQNLVSALLKDNVVYGDGKQKG